MINGLKRSADSICDLCARCMAKNRTNGVYIWRRVSFFGNLEFSFKKVLTNLEMCVIIIHVARGNALNDTG